MPLTMKFDRFRESVREALSHLYDGAFLETHPLAAVLVTQHSGEGRGHALQRVLQEVIQELKPPADLSYDALAWRKYRYLYLRYVQALTLDEIAGDLGISSRQARRYSLESLAAVSQILWDRHLDSIGAQPELDAVGVTAEETDSQARLLPAERPATDAATPVGDLLVGVVDTIRPLADRRGVAVDLAIGDVPHVAAVERTLVRQALLSVIGLCLDVASRSVELRVESGERPGTIALAVRCEPRAAAVAVSQLRSDERLHLAQRLLNSASGSLTIGRAADSALMVRLLVPAVRASRVLIVEDNPDTIQLYRRFLSDSPYHLLPVTDGSHALASAEAEQPALIVLDVMMPGRDGWEVLQMLKAKPSTQHIPVLVCSVLRERELALALGASDFLPKPIRREDLLRALDRLARGQAAARPD